MPAKVVALITGDNKLLQVQTGFLDKYHKDLHRQFRRQGCMFCLKSLFLSIGFD